MVLQSEERKIIHEQFLKIMATAEKSTDSTVLSYFRSLIGRGFSSELLNATFNQMKASGSLRYIRNDELTNALQKYYDVRLPKTSRVPDEMRQFFNDHIVPYMIRHFRFQDLNYIDDSSAHIQHVILDRSTRSDQELVNLLGIRNAAFETALAGYKETLRQANNLITLIKKEYHLK
jgi:hypothetical protein